MEDFKVKDISQAEFGRKEISIAESEMPGLIALREQKWIFIGVALHVHVWNYLPYFLI